MHFALTEEEARLFQEIRTPGGVAAFLEVVCERIPRSRHQESDKAWEPIHRCLTDGYLHYGRSALHKCILGSKNLLGERTNSLVNYVKATDVPTVAAALDRVTEEWMRQRHARIDQKDYDQPLSEGDFKYTWSWFQGVRKFYRRAAKDGDAVLFVCTLC
jgi:hypothetical protein